MRRIKSIVFLSLTLLLFTATCVHVYSTGLLAISPYWPSMTSTHEVFEIWVKNGVTAYYPQLLLVMTDTCYLATTQVEIDFENNDLGVITIPAGAFAMASSVYVPDGYPTGIRFTVASLKDHLGIGGTTQSIYWILVDFPSGATINGLTKYPVEITLDSTSPKMLVYVYGKSVDSLAADYDMKVPPTNPGFMVPEPATIAAVVTPTLTLLAYAYYKRKTS